jgi:hypothetical protein
MIPKPSETPDTDVAELIKRLRNPVNQFLLDHAVAEEGWKLLLEAASALQRQAEENKRILTTHIVVMKEADKRYDELAEELAQARKDAQPVAWVMQSIRDGSISGEIAPTGWATFNERLAQLKNNPWVLNGVAKMVPLYLSPQDKKS